MDKNNKLALTIVILVAIVIFFYVSVFVKNW